MKPMIIIPPGQMSQADIKKLESNQICIVVARDPARVKFFDPMSFSSGGRFLLGIGSHELI